MTWFGFRIIKSISDLALFTDINQDMQQCFDDYEVKEQLASDVMIFSGHLNMIVLPDVKKFKIWLHLSNGEGGRLWERRQLSL